MCFIICIIIIYIFTQTFKNYIMSRTINYTTRTFYVPANKMDTLVQFQNKCKENGHRSYSEVLVNLMEQYIEK